MATSTVTSPFCTWLVAACMSTSSSDKDISTTNSMRTTRKRRLLAKCAAGQYQFRADSSVSALCGSGFQRLGSSLKACDDFNTFLFGSSSLNLNRKQRRVANRAVHSGNLFEPTVIVLFRCFILLCIILLAYS